MRTPSSPENNIGQERDSFTTVRETGDGPVTWWISEALARRAVDRDALPYPVLAARKLPFALMDRQCAHLLMTEHHWAKKNYDLIAGSQQARGLDISVAWPANEAQTLESLIEAGELLQGLDIKPVLFSASASETPKIAKTVHGDPSTEQVDGNGQSQPTGPRTDASDETVAGQGPAHADPRSREPAFEANIVPTEPEAHPVELHPTCTDADKQGSCDAGTEPSDWHAQERRQSRKLSAGSQPESHPDRSSETAELDAVIEAMIDKVVKSDDPATDVLAEFRPERAKGPVSGRDTPSEKPEAPIEPEVDAGRVVVRPDGKVDAADANARAQKEHVGTDDGNEYGDPACDAVESARASEPARVEIGTDQMDADPDVADRGEANPDSTEFTDTAGPDEDAATISALNGDGAPPQTISSLAARVGGAIPHGDAVFDELNPPSPNESDAEWAVQLTMDEARRMFSESADPDVPPMPLVRNGLPVHPRAVDAYEGSIRRVATELRKKNQMFSYGGRLCMIQQMREHDEQSGRDITRPKPVPADWQATAIAIESVVRFTSFRRKTKTWGFVRQARDYYETVLSLSESLFNQLKGTVSMPVLHDRKIISGHIGYHRPTRLWISSPEAFVEEITDQAEAVEILNELVDAYPFASQADKVRALMLPATLLTCRTMMRGMMPLWLFTSKESQVGKSYLVNLLCQAVLGRSPDVQTWHDRPEEIRKALMTALLEDPPLVFFDEITGNPHLHDPSLNRYATADRFYSDRLLGGNKNAKINPVTPLIFSGIGVAPVRDTASRTVVIDLAGDPMKPHPRLADAGRRAQENRNRILGAYQCLLNAQHDEIVSSRFPLWTKVVANPIAAAFSCPTALDCLKASRSAIGGPAMDALVEAMALQPGAVINTRLEPGPKTGLTSSEMLNQYASLLRDLLVPGGTESDLPKAQNLPAWLKKFNNTTSGEYWFVVNAEAKSDNRDTVCRFYLRRRSWAS